MDADSTNNDITHVISLASLDVIRDQITKLREMLIERIKLDDAPKNSETKLESTTGSNNALEDPIKLNVGGKIFMTSKSTFLKEESMLSAMFSGRHELKVITN